MRYVCTVCGYVYDPAIGDPTHGVPPGVSFDNLPTAWVCPVCGADASLFQPELTEGMAQRGPDRGRVVIIGNGVAGFTVASELSEADRGFEIHLVAEEAYHYYARPQLPRVLSGELEPEDLLFYDAEWYEARGIRVYLGDPAVAIDRGGRRVKLRSGLWLSYDWLVLACGSRPFVPPIPGIELPGVFFLRTMDDALRIREYAEGKSSAAVVGGGLLGLEAARGLLRHGVQPVVVERAPYLLPRQLDREGAAVLRRLLERQGMQFRVGQSVEAFVGGGRVEEARLQDGERLPAELVIVGAGVRPETDLAQRVGLSCNRGVVVNDVLQTDDPRIYACGDVAEHRGRVYGIVPPAIEQARVVAAHMRGEAVAYRGSVPATTLKVAGVDVTSVGEVHAEGDDVQHIRAQDAEGEKYRKIVLRSGRVIGAVAIGLRQQVPALLQLVERGVRVGSAADKLAEVGFDPHEVLPG